MTSLLSRIAALPQDLHAWLTGSNSVNILLTGKTGVGKSSLVNSIVGAEMGAEMAPEGHGLDPETQAVTPFIVVINGIEITVWDSPGLQDGTKNEERYLQDMKRRCRKYDLVLYCTKMIDTRLGEDDHKAMEKLTTAFGEDFWKHAVVVTTFANYFPTTRKGRESYTAKYELFKKTLPEKLKGHLKIAAEVAETVPVMPAGYVDAEDPDSRKLPNCQDWLSALWYVSILRMKEGAQPAMLKASMSRIKSPDSITEEDLKKPGHEQPIAAVIPTAVKYGSPPTVMVALGALLGGAVAGPMGAAAGVAAGGAAGAAVDGIIAYFYS